MRWLRPWLRRRAVEREMDAELRFHYDLLVEEFEGRGMAPEEARRRARLEFGGLTQVKDESREARFAGRFEACWRACRIAWRNLTRNPGFAAVAILTLTLAIGLNTLLFSTFEQLLWRSLPVAEPQRLVVLHGNFTTPGVYFSSDRHLSFSWPKYTAFRDRCTVFAGVAARFVTPGSVEYGGSAESVSVELVSGNYFDVLGVRPAAGHLFTPADAAKYMGEPLVVLGYSYWQRRFAGDPAIVGRPLRVNGLKMTVIGVSAAGFHSLDRGNDEELRIPIVMKDLFTPAWPGLDPPDSAWLNIVARVRTGLPMNQAEAGANVLYRKLLQDEAKRLPEGYSHRQEFLNDHLDLASASAGMMDQMTDRRIFFAELAAISGVVLLIACVNLAGLSVARTAARQREIAIRLALGGGPLGVARQLAAENLLLVSLGGLTGVVLAAVLARPAARFLVSGRAGELIDMPLDWRVALFALAVTAFTALAFAVAPALSMHTMQLADVLKTETGARSSLTRVRLRKAMMAAQLALCLWLMIGAGLFARSLAQLKSVDLGFRKEHLITFQLDPTMSGMKQQQALDASRRISDALAQLPGVTAVGSSTYGVLTGNWKFNSAIRIEGYRPPPPDRDTQVRELFVSPGYLRALGMQVVAGRDFTPADVRTPARAAIVNEAFARQYCNGQNAVGRHIWAQAQLQFEIVGVTRSQRYDGPDKPTYPFYYLPDEGTGRRSFYIRTAQPPETMLATVRRVVRGQAPDVPIGRLSTMEELFDSMIGNRSRIAALAGFFGLLATLLAGVGLYGVMAYTVARRTREIGIRMALGAARRDVRGMVIREVAVVIAIGLALGLSSGLALTPLVRSQLYNVSPMDPWAIVAAAGVVAGIALLAASLPARRAARAEPMRALRWE
jgi:predicted permease